MEIYVKPKQKFSYQILITMILSLFISCLIGYFISTWTIDSFIFGTLVRAVIVLIAFSLLFFIQAKVSSPIYDISWIILIAFLAFILIFFIPILIEIQNPFFNANTIQYYSFSLPGGTDNFQGNNSLTLLFYVLQFFLIGIAIILMIISAYLLAYTKIFGDDFDLYSKENKKIYEKEFSKKYNLYNDDFVDNLSKDPDFTIILNVLNDPQRFQNVENVKMGFFSVYGITGDNRKVIRISYEKGLQNFLLTPEESFILLNEIIKLFSKTS